jgi:asparagine synthase (glutamine-hydrolysing)
LSDFSLDLDYHALAQFDLYNFRHIPSPLTPFINIHKLEPGKHLLLDIDGWKVQSEKYFIINHILIKSDPIQQCDQLLQHAVEQTCYADVPVGIFLSGGVDSSLIAAMMKNRNIVTYSL